MRRDSAPSAALIQNIWHSLWLKVWAYIVLTCEKENKILSKRESNCQKTQNQNAKSSANLVYVYTKPKILVKLDSNTPIVGWVQVKVHSSSSPNYFKVVLWLRIVAQNWQNLCTFLFCIKAILFWSKCLTPHLKQWSTKTWYMRFPVTKLSKRHSWWQPFVTFHKVNRHVIWQGH